MDDKTLLRADLASQKAQNDKILSLLSMMERLWPDDEKGKVQSLISEAEATKGILQDCSDRLGWPLPANPPCDRGFKPMQDEDYCCPDVMDCQLEKQAYGYLARLFVLCAPQCTPLPTLMGLCTQIDNLIAGYRIRLGELPGE